VVSHELSYGHENTLGLLTVCAAENVDAEAECESQTPDSAAAGESLASGVRPPIRI